ncbi:hypothetical protein HRS9139_00840 [Pyrenophora teres f. teres]|uniref:HNH endonuclease n=1 Tax=Pyrenophora teres f. teres TaxID=97479 RepID=A0A6S6VK27_9PLEO|nr:hypothetical protein HRS9139_00840 [Pyrenophora teres f. teres]KAE8868338.1 hypothetical protein PTNB29_02249 [Pyrenophora teres f. teres]CAE7023208.1 HNH endonuclease [Pyrenophora teres f. teres]
MPPPDIPTRTSSKRSFKTNDELDFQLFKIQRDLKKIQSDLKPKTSFDSEYWAQAMQMASLGGTKSQLELHKAANNYVAAGQGSEEDFMNTQYARPIQEQVKVWETRQKIYQSRAIELRAGSKNPERRTRHVFMQLFTSSPLGLNIKEAIAGRRESKLQSNFKSEIIRRYDLTSSHPRDYLWSIFSQRYEDADNFTASHIVAWKHGQEMMTAIFGPDAKEDLFSASNGLLLPTKIEKQFDNGLLAIVPAIKDATSKAEVTLWLNQEPREYKMKVFDDGRQTLDSIAFEDYTSGSVVYVTFRDLHDRKLRFRNNFRPRARYLYFHYCCQVLRNAWSKGANAKSVATMEDQKGVFAWGTVGKYMAEDQMRAFVEELGHEFEPLMANADPALNTEADRHVLVDAVAQQIALSAKKSMRGEFDEEEEEEEDDDDDDDEDDDK